MEQSSFFNLKDYKTNEYLKHLYNPENRYQAAELYKEQQLEEKAESAVKSTALFGQLTLREKLAEMGVGEMVINQLKDTAMNMVTGVASPVLDYLKNIDIVLDETKYNTEFQTVARTIFQSNMAMGEDAKRGVYVNGLTNTRLNGENEPSTATRFVYNM